MLLNPRLWAVIYVDVNSSRDRRTNWHWKPINLLFKASTIICKYWPHRWVSEWKYSSSKHNFECSLMCPQNFNNVTVVHLQQEWEFGKSHPRKPNHVFHTALRSKSHFIMSNKNGGIIINFDMWVTLRVDLQLYDTEVPTGVWRQSRASVFM